jgi:hypothetical protein
MLEVVEVELEKEESILSEENQMLAATSPTESGDKVISAKLVVCLKWRHQAETLYTELYEYEKDLRLWGLRTR